MSGLDLILQGFLKSVSAPFISLFGKEMTVLMFFGFGALATSKVLDTNKKR